MLTLGIETSCDETAAAIVTPDGEVISSIVSSQIRIHRPYGGVVPELASRTHVKNLLPVISEALNRASCNLSDIDGIAVTYGPGLIGALMVGINMASSIAWALSKPLVGVNHLKGHLFAIFLKSKLESGKSKCNPKFPFIGLVVSGGHTSLFVVNGKTDIKLIGSTRDDAAGEALDKAAKALGLGYPGGPEIEKKAEKFRGKPSLRFPKGLIHSRSPEFSFSGMKTSLISLIKKRGLKYINENIEEICFAYQEAIFDVLIKKSLDACKAHSLNEIVVSGGVAVNKRLRKKFTIAGLKNSIEIFFPAPEFTTDNAAMIALAGSLLLEKGISMCGKLKAIPYPDLKQL